MSSGYSPWIYRNFLYHVPWLYVKCSEGNYHPRWRSRVCFCRDDCDLVDMKTGKRYVTEERYNRLAQKTWSQSGMGNQILKHFAGIESNHGIQSDAQEPRR